MGDDHGRSKDVGKVVGAVSKAVLESGMDLSGLRMGKTRLVARNKRKSTLKKVILEEREERKQLHVQDTSWGSAWQPGSSRPTWSGSSVLSIDAPEFVPAALHQQFADEAPLGAGATPAGGASAPSSASAPREGAGAAGAGAGSFSRQEKIFVPSWCKPPQEPQLPPAEGCGQSRDGALAAAPAEAAAPPAGAAAAAEEDAEEEEELPVAEAMERMRISQEAGRKQEKKAKEPAKGADLEVRHYVHQVLSDELDEKVKVMLSNLVRFQERAKEKDPLKYEKQKRFCVGMREAKRSILRRKAKCLVLAPNLEVSTAEGGLDETVEDLIEVARENEVPVVFALSRNRMGKAIGKNIRLSIIAVVSAEGAHKEFKEILELTNALRRQWVMQQMSRLTSEDAEEARRRAEEKAAQDAKKREDKARLEAERKEEEERKRREAQEAKLAEKARREAERKAEIERRRLLKAARANDPALLAEKARQEAEAKAEAERQRAEEDAAREAVLEAQRLRREALLKAEEERRAAREEAKRAEEEAKRAARAAEEGSESDDDSDVDLPAGFNDDLF